MEMGPSTAKSGATHEDHHAPGRTEDTRPPDPGAHGHDPGNGGHHADHSTHAGHDPEVFRRKFWLSLALTVPVVFWADMVQEWFGYTAPEFPGSNWIAPVLGTVIFVYGGAPFLQGAYREIRRRQPGMMLLIAMAITVAFVASVASSLGWFDLEFWWELAALITIMLLGHWQEMKAIGQAQGALDALADLLPDDAERVSDGQVETVAGDLVASRRRGAGPAGWAGAGRRRDRRRRRRGRRVDGDRGVPTGGALGG